ncbi:MAG: 2-C-methyl-D-erythritol 2,4-cyclodiphosphate synthase [Chthonomonas sp.]|nr:2-C-methyl-D-erythritol 2,4-cyclodiphosphate synthase [Chthonomonas sp.]
MRVAAIILAAGSSSRFGSDKLQVQIGGLPVWRKSVQAFLNHPEIDLVGIVGTHELVSMARQHEPNLAFAVVGGQTRQASAHRGMLAVPGDVELVLIHDAARPFVSEKLITEVIAAATEHGASCPALPVKETIKQIKNGTAKTLERAQLVAVQTPQAGRLQDFLRAHEGANAEFTDDLALLESIGIIPHFVEGDEKNLKITTPSDAAKMNSVMEYRTGIGYDIHRFSDDPERPMILGGIEFDDRPGLDGHSDADALIHAVVDAIMGATGQGDIGVHFPNDDSSWKNVSSKIFLQKAGDLAKEFGWEIVNIDVSVVAERPRIMVRGAEICGTIAEVLRINPQRVSVKATTNEKLGAIGRSEGIAALAIATVRRPEC